MDHSFSTLFLPLSLPLQSFIDKPKISDFSENRHALSKNTDISEENLHQDVQKALLHVGSCISQASHDTASLMQANKTGHSPSEASTAFIWPLSFDRVLAAV